MNILEEIKFIDGNANIVGFEFEQQIYYTHHLHVSKDKYIPRCLKCFPLLSGYSKEEKEVVEFIKKIYTGKIKENNKKLIKPYELDIVLPELKIAIEFNGNYFHSIESGKYQLGYHLMKTEMCEKLGYRLIHILENDWLTKQEDIKNKLKNIILKLEKIDYTSILNRCWYQKQEINGYRCEVILPTIEVIKTKYKTFSIENCGFLKYIKIN